MVSQNIPVVWEGDLLERKQVSTYLTNYLSKRYILEKDEDGFVLAINAE